MATNGTSAIKDSCPVVVTVTMNPAIDVFAVTEEIYDDSKSRCQRASREPGGGGINVARNLNRFGIPARVIFPEGGVNGALLKKLLDEEKTPYSAVTVKDETRQNFAVTERSSGKMHHFVFPGPELTEAELQSCRKSILEQASETDYLVLSGSIPASVPDNFYGDIIRATENHSEESPGKQPKVILDSSGRALKGALYRNAYLAKLNRKEFAELGYSEHDEVPALVKQMQKEVSAGAVQNLIVTLSKGGAVLVTASGDAIFMMPPEVKIVSHVGAGDSFVSALTWQLCKHGDLKQAFKYGVAAACTTVQSEGNQLTDFDLLERMLNETQQLAVSN